MNSKDHVAGGGLRVPDKIRYIAIEGVIGAGKTTLARLLSDRIDAKIVLEEFEDNPFLETFYHDQERWAFHTQLSFLASRFRQQKQLLARDLFHQVVVSDYTFDKDRIFARTNLRGDELQLYESLFGIMETSMPVPDLVVYLQHTPDRLMHHISDRDRPYERLIEEDYIRSLVEAYNTYFFNYTRSPLLVVQAGDLDYVKYPEHRDMILREILSFRFEGTRYIHFSDLREPGDSLALPFD